jgi:outer membrane immunogenic protein
MNMRNPLLPTVALVALAGSALAADLPSTKSAPVFTALPPAYNWTGLYVGADVGGGFANSNSTWATDSLRGSGSGVVGGGLVGYNYQVNNFVLGLQGDYQGAGISSSRTETTSRGVVLTGKGSQDYLAAFNGRLGLAFDRALFYAIGGVAFTEGRNDLSGSFNGAALPALSISHSYTGYDVGAGIEYAFLPNWTGRIEYRYYGFGIWNYPADSWALPGRSTLNYSTVTFGIAYRFGDPIAAEFVAKY